MSSRERALQAVEYYNNSVLRARAGAGLVGPHRVHGGSPGQQQHASSNDTLYRSNSSLELTPDHSHYHQHQGPGGVLRREYGSHGSIDVIASGGAPGAPGPGSGHQLSTGETFFAMLREYRPAVLGVGPGSGPGPGPGTGDHTDDPHSHSPPSDRHQNAANTSPKLRLKLHRFWGGVSAPLSAPAAPGGTRAPLDDSAMGSVPQMQGEPEVRRRAFAHYDVQSISANLGYAARLRGLLLARRRNTTTGASAASMLGARSTTPDTSSRTGAGAGTDSGEEDLGDGNSNHLLESCPFFRNEVGGEGERVVSLTRTPSSCPGPGPGPLHRPALACGVSVLEMPPGETHWKQGACPYQRPLAAVESVDQGALYYRKFFYGQEHQNWFGMDENLGPVAASIKREVAERPARLSSDSTAAQPVYQYRLLIRTSELLTLRGSILEDAIPNLKSTSNNNNSSNSTNNKAMMNTKEVLEYVAPELQLSCLRLGVSSPQTEEQLLKLDEQGLSNHYKVGVMYCRAGQGTEEEMYNNEEAGPAFQEFLETIGQRVRLKGFDKYKAGLDNKTDSTGLYSVYAQYQDCEIMFHVSTMLPFTPNNRQQLLRKRHIGNDIVTIVFQEPGAQPFTPKNIRSQFQHVFIVVRAINPCSENTQYSIAVSRSKEVPMFGPPIKEGATYRKGKSFADFLVAKVINAENAAHRSEKFATMATRTRQEYLKDLANNYTVTTLVKTGQKFSMLSFSSKKSREKDKDKDRALSRPPRFLPDAAQRGALCWQVVLEDSGQSALVDCFLAISVDTVVLVEDRTREIVFVTPCSAMLGWATHSNSLRLYHHQGECTRLHMRESLPLGSGSGSGSELVEVMVRLRSVTPGSVAQELTLRRNHMGQLGFHVQPDGVVTQVESHGQAWQAGLRQGARLVEICKVAVSTLTHDQMVDLLKTSMLVTVTVIPPLSDGSPRRGCSLANCKYNAGNYEGDYENLANSNEDANTLPPSGVGLPNGKSSPRKGAAQLQQVVPGNHRRRYERSFSPPRSSNSSGYGTGSSSKSFTGADRFPSSVEGTLTNSLTGQSDDRWYELLEPSDGTEPPAAAHGALHTRDSPPPLPARLGSGSGSGGGREAGAGSAFQLVTPNGATHHTKVHSSQSLPLPHANYSLPLGVSPAKSPVGGQGLHHNFKVGDRVRCGDAADSGVFSRHEIYMKTRTAAKSDYPPTSDMSKSASLPLEVAGLRVLSISDGHSTDTSSADDLSAGSNSVSPGLRRSSKPALNSGTPTPPSNGRNQSPRPRDVGEARLRPGVTARSSQRNSANLHNSTLQEDLMRLINPDYLGETEVNNKRDKESSSTPVSTNGNTPDNLPHVKSRSRENLCGTSNSVLEPTPATGPSAEASEVILTTARPATVISNASTASSPAPSENKLSKEERLSPRVTKVGAGAGSSAMTISPLPLPDAQDMDWPSLVDTATRAMRAMRSAPSQHAASNGEQERERDRIQEADGEAAASESSGGSSWMEHVAERLGLDTSVSGLEGQLAQLQARLTRETHLRLSLEDEVRRLRDENRRLHDESQAAAQQLRRFTEWFFQTIDRQ